MDGLLHLIQPFEHKPQTIVSTALSSSPKLNNKRTFSKSSRKCCEKKKGTSLVYFYYQIVREHSWPKGLPSGAPYTCNYRNRTTCMCRNRKLCNSFSMVNTASGMDCGHRRLTTMTTTPQNMAAIVQLIGQDNQGIQPWLTVYIFNIGHPCCKQHSCTFRIRL